MRKRERRAPRAPQAAGLIPVWPEIHTRHRGVNRGPVDGEPVIGDLLTPVFNATGAETLKFRTTSPNLGRVHVFVCNVKN